MRFFLYLFLLLGFSLIEAKVAKSTFKLYIEKEKIAQKIKETAKEINTKYQDEELVLVMIMRGSFIFVADFIRELNDPVKLEYVSCSSYGIGNKRKELSISRIDNLNIEDKCILLVDDIFDSGNTLYSVREALLQKKPKSLETIVLLYKEDSKKITNFIPDRYLFKVPNHFIIGYGLDFNEHYRGLKDIYIVEKH